MSTWRKNNVKEGKLYDRDWKYKKNFGKAMREQHGVDGQAGYDFLLEQQDYKCKLCGIHNDDVEEQKQENINKKKLNKTRQWKTPNFVHDHNHDTGVVRGLICSRCNTSIGGYEKCIAMGEKKIQDYLNGKND